jgi:histone acetyltransferase (RNA polymerase elongator complex component)
MSNGTHKNIPIFIPHLGCPNDCVFCNQKIISGKQFFDRETVDAEILNYVNNVNSAARETDVEIAFFGGSFTGIETDEMVYLLETAEKYITENGCKVNSIRLSTRPDYIDERILDILSRYHVGTIELGIQSLDDKTLETSKRGHTAAQSIRACKLVKAYGFNLVGQMMIGLPGSSPDSEVMTAETLCTLGIDGARIYPIVVFKNTELEVMTENGEYQILGEDELIHRTAKTLSVFIRNSVNVLRIGLCSSDNLDASESNEIYTGSYHPAIGELAENAVYYELIKQNLDKYAKSTLSDANITVYCPIGAISKVIGHKRSNKIKIQSEYNVKNVKVIEKDGILNYNISIDVSN